jgi:hypothetical protein
MSNQIWPIVPYGAFTLATPTIPKFYWDVYSQEQRWKTICCELGKLITYADAIGVQVNINTDQIKKLWEEFETFKESGFFDYYAEQIEKWINENMERIISEAIKMVFFGLTPDGYFCAYIPKSWAGIMFDTGMVYGEDDYGCLILEY